MSQFGFSTELRNRSANNVWNDALHWILIPMQHHPSGAGQWNIKVILEKPE
tara:strand:+ start:406 stop:558 length:153 start_codon:yes stop_codon:yes gene_type:complete